jgi:hypothetical protein
MGLAKRMLEEIWERGWESIGKSICPDCLENPALKELAADNLDEDECDYCGREGENVAVDTDVVMTRIGESFHSEYRDPVHELPYDSGEGGYQGDWFHTYDLLDRLGEEIGVQEFVDDMIQAFGLQGWCERDYFTLRADQALSFSWQRFGKLVKEDSRYLFLERREDDEYREQHEVEPADMLRKLGELVVETDLIRELEPGTRIYRARDHGLGVAYDRAVDLGTAPREAAFANRMSPAGIPLFYGAFDADTAVREAWAGPAPDHELVSVGRFANSAPLRVIDLASLPPIPSIFDEDLRHLRPPLWFLFEFSGRISAPVRTAARSEAEMVEYVPTQIVSEYLRTTFARDYGEAAVHGLLYRSAAHEGGICCALFIAREDCVDADSGQEGGWPVLVLDHTEVRDRLPGSPLAP